MPSVADENPEEQEELETVCPFTDEEVLEALENMEIIIDYHGFGFNDIEIKSIKFEGDASYGSIDVIMTAQIENEFYKMVGTHEVKAELFVEDNTITRKFPDLAVENTIIKPTIPFKKDFLFRQGKTVLLCPDDYIIANFKYIHFDKEHVADIEFFKRTDISEDKYGHDDFKIEYFPRITLADGRTS